MHDGNKTFTNKFTWEMRLENLKRVSGPVLSYILQIDATSVFLFREFESTESTFQN